VGHKPCHDSIGGMAMMWTPDVDDAAQYIADYLDGYSTYQIIEKHNLSVSAVTVINFLRRHKVEIRQRGTGFGLKTCVKCDSTFTPTIGSQVYCVDCGSTYKKRANLLKHGITEEQYAFLLQRSNECCELCGFKPEEGWKALAIDHDHNTGLIRGLLCRSCNLTMGYLDNPEWMAKALTYQTANHIEPFCIGRNHPEHNGEDYRRNPNYGEGVVQDHG